MVLRWPMAEGKNVEALVLGLIAEIAPPGTDRAAITPDTSLRSGLGLDSLRLTAFLTRLGEALDADPDEFIELVLEAPINTVADAVALGSRALGGAGSAGA